MTTAPERAYFDWHARDIFTGQGAMVDLGSWFGSTTAALATGLSANRRPSARSKAIHAFDQFRWEAWMDTYTDFAHFGPYRPGDSFLPEFEYVVEPWRGRIEIHEGDLRRQSWTQGPIELLLVDAMKSWDLASHIVENFYTAMAPTAGYIIHQDYAHCFTPWIHLVSYRLRECFAPTADVLGSETVAFRLLRGVPSLAARSLARETFRSDEVDAAFDYSLSITKSDKHSGIRAARIMLLVYDGDLDRAMSDLRRSEQDHLLNPFHVSAVQNAISELRTGRGG
jgi:hypothetical protein